MLAPWIRFVMGFPLQRSAQPPCQGGQEAEKGEGAGDGEGGGNEEKLVLEGRARL